MVAGEALIDLVPARRRGADRAPRRRAVQHRAHARPAGAPGCVPRPDLDRPLRRAAGRAARRRRRAAGRAGPHRGPDHARPRRARRARQRPLPLLHEGTAAPGLTLDDALAALPAATAYLHVGTLGLVLEPIGDRARGARRELARARARDGRPELPARRSSPTPPRTARGSRACSRSPTSSRSPRRTSPGWSRAWTRPRPRAACSPRGRPSSSSPAAATARSC